MFIWESRLVRVPEISVFRTGISISGLENVAILTLQPGYRDESGINFSNEFYIVLLYMLYFPHHKHLIKLQWYRLAIRVVETIMIDRRESFNFVFPPYLLCFSNLAPELPPPPVSSRGPLLSTRKPGLIFSFESKAKLVPVWNALKVNLWTYYFTTWGGRLSWIGCNFTLLVSCCRFRPVTWKQKFGGRINARFFYDTPPASNFARLSKENIYLKTH